MQLDNLLTSLTKENVSDIHFKAGRPPLLRIQGSIVESNLKPLTPKDTEDLCRQILTEEQAKRFLEMNECDTSHSIPGFARFRVNIFKQRSSVSIVMRIIPFTIPSIDELNLPEVVKSIALAERGLILVTGTAGSGKSWTLSSIINHINENRKCHIITIEDPIEFLHKDKLAAINQREVGVDTHSFANAFKSALRQDPNVILVGELRDTASMEIALRAAETGHLVLSTLHTTDAKETVNRLIDSFPPHQHKQMRLQISTNLHAIISQRLLERLDGKGRIVAAEIMIATAAIKSHILAPHKVDEIQENMSKGKDQYGMQTFDQALLELVLRNWVSVEEALKYASSPNDFKLQINLGSK